MIKQQNKVKMTTSKVWEYYIIDESDDSKAVCGECNQKVVRGVGKSATTSSLWNHLKYKHSHLYQKRKEEEAKESGRKVLKQAQITSHFGGFGKQWDINNPKSLEIHKVIGEMIALDNQPFTIVEDKGIFT